MNKILTFFVAAIACCYGVVYAVWTANWFAMFGWLAAALFAVIIAIMLIIYPQLQDSDDYYE